MRLYKRVPDTDERGHTVVYELATPSEVAAAHPKCGTCGHKTDTDVNGYIRCSNQNSACFNYVLVAFEEYCPHHTELTGGGDE